MKKSKSKTPIIKFAEASIDLLHRLSFRWKDESQYENLQDYIRPFRKIAKACGVELVAMQSRPFGIVAVEGTFKSGTIRTPYTVAVYANGKSVVRPTCW